MRYKTIYFFDGRRSGVARGFTLIEILLVVMIIGILSSMVLPDIAGRAEKAKTTAARVDIESNLAMALDLYELDNGSYPTTVQGLDALVRRPKGAADGWGGPYLKRHSVPHDPWGRDYVYRYPAPDGSPGYRLFSFGRDGVESDDDIGNPKIGVHADAP